MPKDIDVHTYVKAWANMHAQVCTWETQQAYTGCVWPDNSKPVATVEKRTRREILSVFAGSNVNRPSLLPSPF
jgi:hypothetical protein